MSYVATRVALLAAVMALLAAAGCAPQAIPPPRMPTTQPPLQNTSWMLDSLGTPEKQEVSLPGSDTTLSFSVESTFSGNAGCNAYHGTYVSDTDGTLAMKSLLHSEIYCAWPEMLDQEQAFLDYLAAAERYEFIEGKLHISGGGALLVLSPD